MARQKQNPGEQKAPEINTNELLEKHKVSVLYSTSDGNLFYSAYAAKTHAITLENKKVNEIRKT